MGGGEQAWGEVADVTKVMRIYGKSHALALEEQIFRAESFAKGARVPTRRAKEGAVVASGIYKMCGEVAGWDPTKSLYCGPNNRVLEEGRVLASASSYFSEKKDLKALCPKQAYHSEALRKQEMSSPGRTRAKAKASALVRD